VVNLTTMWRGCSSSRLFPDNSGVIRDGGVDGGMVLYVERLRTAEYGGI